MNIKKGKALELLQHPLWELVEEIIKETTDKIRRETPKSDSEFLTLWNVAYKEGMIDGMNLIVDKLNEYAQKP